MSILGRADASILASELMSTRPNSKGPLLLAIWILGGLVSFVILDSHWPRKPH